MPLRKARTPGENELTIFVGDLCPFHFKQTASKRNQPLLATWALLLWPTYPAAVDQVWMLWFVAERGFKCRTHKPLSAHDPSLIGNGSQPLNMKLKRTSWVGLFFIIFHFTGSASGLRDKIPCIDSDKFYRNPNRDPAHVWSIKECSKYFYCVEGEVFEFECSTGLNFDINRQICDFKDNVGNCDVTAEVTTPKPLFNTDEPICPVGEHACADGTCLPTALFCDGHPGRLKAKLYTLLNNRERTKKNCLAL